MHAQALANLGPGLLMQSQSLDCFGAKGAHTGELETVLFSRHYCYTGLSVAPGRIQQSEHRAPGSPPTLRLCM